MCPLIEQAETKCAAHWTIQNVFETFAHCANHYENCPVYRELVREQEGAAYEPNGALRAAS